MKSQNNPTWIMSFIGYKITKKLSNNLWLISQIVFLWLVFMFFCENFHFETFILSVKRIVGSNWGRATSTATAASPWLTSRGSWTSSSESEERRRKTIDVNSKVWRFVKK